MCIRDRPQAAAQPQPQAQAQQPQPSQAQPQIQPKPQSQPQPAPVQKPNEVPKPSDELEASVAQSIEKALANPQPAPQPVSNSSGGIFKQNAPVSNKTQISFMPSAQADKPAANTGFFSMGQSKGPQRGPAASQASQPATRLFGSSAIHQENSSNQGERKDSGAPTKPSGGGFNMTSFIESGNGGKEGNKEGGNTNWGNFSSSDHNRAPSFGTGSGFMSQGGGFMQNQGRPQGGGLNFGSFGGASNDKKEEGNSGGGFNFGGNSGSSGFGFGGSQGQQQGGGNSSMFKFRK
eukprot:TRINITY_DN15391_c0_g1_i1.p1 TRINITY_DN15391_c0_g1~~TRINITY_DN15391_c0_g1_i1.p1  ORF type:complete len:291 (-),score=76.16 TRINITY_DN15391_c0_g1_i1:118-990(-)